MSLLRKKNLTQQLELNSVGLGQKVTIIEREPALHR